MPFRLHPDDLKALAKEIASLLIEDRNLQNLKEDSIAQTLTLNVMEVSRILNLNKNTVQKYLRIGLLKGTKNGKSWTVTQQSLNEYLNGTPVL